MGNNLHNFFCLTFILGSKCNLACKYCYAPKQNNSIRYSFSGINQWSLLVAKNCKRTKRPFIVGFHGGNEPLLYIDQIIKILDLIHPICQKFDLPLKAFTTTSGIISHEILSRATKYFSGITLSWDGPPVLQDKQRPLVNEGPSSEIVEKSFVKLMQSNIGATVRSTITLDSCQMGTDLVKFYQQKGVKNLVFHPVYQDLENRIPTKLIPGPQNFVPFFLKSRQWARQNDINLMYSGVRLYQMHGQFCPPLQHNLTITPEGFFTFCFLAVHNLDQKNKDLVFGHIENGPFEVKKKLDGLKSKFIQHSEQCENCYLVNHCSKACPNVCPLKNRLDDFDCRENKWIGTALMLEQKGHTLTLQEIENPESMVVKYHALIDDDLE